MARVNVILEIVSERREAFAMHAAATESESEAERQALEIVSDLSGYGIEIEPDPVPVPMFTEFSAKERPGLEALATFATNEISADVSSRTMVMPIQLESTKLDAIRSRKDVKVWPNSELHLYEINDENTEDDPIDLARSRPGVDCREFRPAVSIARIRRLLGTDRAWADGYRGQNVVVGIIDEGVDGDVYPVVGGFSRPNASRRPGSAPITSHGSMCAADILVAAPAARFYDYPFLGVPNSGGAITMFQEALEHRRRDGTPHLTSNSYGFVGLPDRDRIPDHEVWDIDHPLHRKVREVVASGASVFFSAGNCGVDCPSSNCHFSGIGPGRSIHGSNSLDEVVTVAAVNARHERIGYSSQGPGLFEQEKPDVAAYSHFYGNFGPGRPAGGGPNNFDNGTSASTPLAAGVGALLLSAFPDTGPRALKDALVASAHRIDSVDWSRDYGHGVVNAAAAYDRMRRTA